MSSSTLLNGTCLNFESNFFFFYFEFILDQASGSCIESAPNSPRTESSNKNTETSILQAKSRHCLLDCLSWTRTISAGFFTSIQSSESKSISSEIQGIIVSDEASNQLHPPGAEQKWRTRTLFLCLIKRCNK